MFTFLIINRFKNPRFGTVAIRHDLHCQKPQLKPSQFLKVF
jgi:hypothetical protein